MYMLYIDSRDGYTDGSVCPYIFLRQALLYYMGHHKHLAQVIQCLSLCRTWDYTFVSSLCILSLML